MAELPPDVSHHPDVGFSLVQGDPPYRIQQKLGLILRRGLGVPRRVLCFMLLTWVPIMMWALVHERVYAGVVAEPLLQTLAFTYDAWWRSHCSSWWKPLLRGSACE
jgi:hypothetical protein